ncbi:MAG: leucyl aminopeptidase [Dehalococcoidia bacterium]|nr:leucyl aminopeptidase [Dehalococcoidia bacterium]
MNFEVVAGDIGVRETDAIVVNLFQGIASPGGATGAVDGALDGAITRLIADGEITGKHGEVTVIHTLGKMAPARVVVAGLGKSSDFDAEAVRSVSGETARRLQGIGVSRYSTIAHGAGIGGMDAAQSGQAIVEGTVLGLYDFDRFKSSKDGRKSVEAVEIVEFDSSKLASLQLGVDRGMVQAEAVAFCRNMVNEPGNRLTPSRMAERALKAADDAGLEIEVLDRPDLEALGMGAFLGVAQGSKEPPKLIIMKYEGDPDNPGNNLAIVGKGITFDSGGISIKPSANMGDMKGDMAGGAAVISAMKVIGQVGPKINVTGIVAATENMPGGGAQRPGDIVRTMSGKTIEIDNTDAEGRLVLADAVYYAHEQGIRRIVDIATLTGAMSIALGHICSGLFGNDQGFIDRIKASGDAAGERLWQLPTYDEYKEQYRSDVADMRNIGGRPAGSITGALIIGEFAGDAAWAHVDIAGTSFSSKTSGYTVKGGTGVMVRTLVKLAEALAGE